MKPISEIVQYIPFGKSRAAQLLKNMEKKGIVTIEEGTKYIIKYLEQKRV